MKNQTNEAPMSNNKVKVKICFIILVIKENTNAYTGIANFFWTKG